MLRNKTYRGLTKVPEFNEEEEYYVPGSHEPLVSEELFDEVQFVLRKLVEKKCISATKVKQREEFPLRGLLICPECSRNLTGSLSKSHNRRYIIIAKSLQNKIQL